MLFSMYIQHTVRLQLLAELASCPNRAKDNMYAIGIFMQAALFLASLA
jgi:hypothetical protein